MPSKFIGAALKARRLRGGARKQMLREKSLKKSPPSRPTKLLETLNVEPKLQLQGVQSLRVSLSDNTASTSFQKTSLPRLVWANPNLSVSIQKTRKHEQAAVRLLHNNGSKNVVSLFNQPQSKILSELMDAAGGPQWSTYKSEHAKDTNLLPVSDVTAWRKLPKRKPKQAQGPTLNLNLRSGPRPFFDASSLETSNSVDQGNEELSLGDGSQENNASSTKPESLPDPLPANPFSPSLNEGHGQKSNRPGSNVWIT